MDITPVFNQVLAAHKAQPITPRVLRVADLDGFLQEAYRIRSHIAKLHGDLAAIRQSYLSTAHPPQRTKHYLRASASAPRDKDAKYLTDVERAEIDAQAKQSLRDLNYAINTLRDAEQIRQTTESQLALRKRAQQGLGALGRWAAGGAVTAKSADEALAEAKANSINAHRESIIWSLQNQLEACGRFQSSMMEIRLLREVEKSKSVLYKTRATGPGHLGPVPPMSSHATDGSESARAGVEAQLDAEQLQLFAQENQDMLQQYEDQLDKVRCVCPSSIHPGHAPSKRANQRRRRAQRDGEVADGNRGAAVDAGQQPQRAVGAH